MLALLCVFAPQFLAEALRLYKELPLLCMFAPPFLVMVPSLPVTPGPADGAQVIARARRLR